MPGFGFNRKGPSHYVLLPLMMAMFHPGGGEGRGKKVQEVIVASFDDYPLDINFYPPFPFPFPNPLWPSALAGNLCFPLSLNAFKITSSDKLPSQEGEGLWQTVNTPSWLVLAECLYCLGTERKTFEKYLKKVEIVLKGRKTVYFEGKEHLIRF